MGSALGDRVKAAAASVNRRGQDVTAHRHFHKTAGAILAITVATATASLAASSSGTAAPTRNAAETLPASKPNYLLPVGTLVSNGSLPEPTLAGDTGTKGVPAGTPPVPTTGTSPVDPSIRNYGGGAGTLTPVGIATLALEAGCSAAAAPTATAVSMAESGGSPSAQGDITLMTAEWDWSAGLWQIRGLRAERGTGALRDSVANQDAISNAAAMYTISNGCTDWTPWTTYNVGIYQQYMGVAQSAVDYVLAYQRSHGGQYPPVAPPDPTAVIPVGGSGGAAGPAQAQAAQSASAHRSPATRPKAPARATSSAAAPGAPRSSAAPKPAASSTAGGPVAPVTSAAPTPQLTLPQLLPSTTPKILPTITIPPILPSSVLPLPTVTLPGL